MSAYQQKDNEGSLWRAQSKPKETSRDYEGSCMIDGQEYWISGWINTAKSSGKKYQGLKFQKKESKPDEPQQDTFSVDDDVPF